MFGVNANKKVMIINSGQFMVDLLNKCYKQTDKQSD